MMLLAPLLRAMLAAPVAVLAGRARPAWSAPAGGLMTLLGFANGFEARPNP